MALSSSLNYKEFTASAAQTVFAFGEVLYFSETHLQVYVDGVLKTLGVDYTCWPQINTSNGTPGGTITFVDEMVGGETVLIKRVVPIVQSIDYQENEKFPADTHEKGLDWLTMVAHQHDEEHSRMIKLPVTETGSTASTTFPALSIRSNKYAAWNSSGEFIALDPATASGTSVTAAGSTTARLLADRFADVKNILDYGAVGNNSTDCAAAITAAYDACPANGAIFVPPGIYRYNTALSFGTKTVAWIGCGSHISRFRYNGANTTNDCFTVGDGVNPVIGWELHGIGFDSNTVMTGGNGVRLKALARCLGGITDTFFGHQDGNKNFYHGVYFDQCDAVSMTGFECKASQDGLRLRGHTLGAAGLHLYHFKINECAVGIRCGGGFGGLWIDQGDVIANAKNIVLDETLQATSNREIFLGPSLALDTGGSVGVYNGTNFEVGGTGGVIFCNNTWNASAGTLVKINSSFAGQIYFIGGYLYNALTADGGNGRAIDNASTSASIYVSSTVFANCVGAGIYTSVSNTHLYLNNPIFKPDVTNPVHTSFTTADQRISFTPTITFGGGATGLTYTTQLGGWVRQGNRVFGQLYIKLSAKGSSTGSAVISLSGLPDVTANNLNLGNSGRGAYAVNMASLNGTVTGLVGTGPVLNLYHTGATGIGSLTEGHFTNTSEIGIGFDYFVA